MIISGHNEYIDFFSLLLNIIDKEMQKIFSFISVDSNGNRKHGMNKTI